MIDESHLISQVIFGIVLQQGNWLLRGWTSNPSRGSSLDCTSCSLPQKQSNPSILTLALRSLFRRPNNPMYTLWCFAKHTCISHHKAHLVCVDRQQYWKQQASLQLLPSWWFQPIWKICSSNRIISPLVSDAGWKENIFETTTGHQKTHPCQPPKNFCQAVKESPPGPLCIVLAAAKISKISESKTKAVGGKICKKTAASTAGWVSKGRFPTYLGP